MLNLLKINKQPNPNAVLEPIYAFRTITTMLSLIQCTCGTEITNAELKSTKTVQHSQLRILDARREAEEDP
jgi:hypothetical protein